MNPRISTAAGARLSPRLATSVRRLLAPRPRPSRRSTGRRFRRPARRRNCASRRGRRRRSRNGAELIVSEKHDLPLVSFSLLVHGRRRPVRDGRPARRGEHHRLDAERGNEDARRRGALQRAAVARHVGAAPASAASRGRWASSSTTAKFAPTLDILADMLLNSTFPAPALERLRGAAAGRAQHRRRRSPARLPAACSRRSLYGTAHPFGQLATEETLKAITRDDVVAFHKSVLPAGARAIVVVGDVTPASAKAPSRRRWPRGRPAAASRTSRTRRCPQRRPTTIYLVDKPGAAQSTFAIGQPGPAAQHARLLRAPGDEHAARRHVPVAPQRQHPRGEGAELRRQLALRRSARARARSARAATSSRRRATWRSSSS